GEGQHRRGALVFSGSYGAAAAFDQLVDRVVAHRTTLVDQLHEAQVGLLLVGRQRPGTDMGVDHQQMDRVGSDVQDTHTHDADDTDANTRRALDHCRFASRYSPGHRRILVRSKAWSFARRPTGPGSSSPTRPTPARSSGVI